METVMERKLTPATNRLINLSDFINKEKDRIWEEKYIETLVKFFEEKWKEHPEWNYFDLVLYANVEFDSRFAWAILAFFYHQEVTNGGHSKYLLSGRASGFKFDENNKKELLANNSFILSFPIVAKQQYAGEIVFDTIQRFDYELLEEDEVVVCSNCLGTGSYNHHVCPVCDGTGKITFRKEKELTTDSLEQLDKLDNQYLEVQSEFYEILNQFAKDLITKNYINQ